MEEKYKGREVEGDCLNFCSEGSQMLKINEVRGLHKSVGAQWYRAHFGVELDSGTPDKRG